MLANRGSFEGHVRREEMDEMDEENKVSEMVFFLEQYLLLIRLLRLVESTPIERVCIEANGTRYSPMSKSLPLLRQFIERSMPVITREKEIVGEMLRSLGVELPDGPK